MAFRLTSAGRALLVLAGLASLGACSSAPPLFTADGRSTTQVQCPASGPAATCEQAATGLCGGAFDTIGTSLKAGLRTLIFACRATPQ